MEKGKVYLIGAGPGDPGLLTVKGKKILNTADVIVYDALIGAGILAEIPADKETINVGKRAGHHLFPQEEINEILLREALKGKTVVRLKGGDPFLFGRGGEELELLTAHDIPYEVIPGITSAIAVPAYNGIPVTHRDCTSSLHIITGHKKEGEKLTLDFPSLVKMDGTLVFLMSVASLTDIAEGLISAGMNPDMPAALLSCGTVAMQKKIISAIKVLPEEVIRQGAKAPAVLIVGKVCALSEQFDWCVRRPLFGCRVLVTRPKRAASKFPEKLRMLGAEVLELPAIELRPLPAAGVLSDRLRTAGSYDWIVLTSPSGVDIFFEDLQKLKLDLRMFCKTHFAVLGEGTKKALSDKGLISDLMPKMYDGESLGTALAAVCTKGTKVLIPRAKTGNPELVRELLKAGALVDDVATYETIYVKSKLVNPADYLTRDRDCVVFTSSSTVKGFVQAMPEGFDLSKVKAACIGEKTAETAKSFGMCSFTAEQATMDSLLELVIRMMKDPAVG